MLGRSYIAEESRAAHCRHGSADCCRYVVISGSYIGYERPENVEGSTHAYCLLNLHIGSYLVHRNVSGALNHNLNVLFPSSYR